MGFAIRSWQGRQFHHVKEVACVVVTANLEDVHQTFVAARNGFGGSQTLELAVEEDVFFARLAMDDFTGAEGAGTTSRRDCSSQGYLPAAFSRRNCAMKATSSQRCSSDSDSAKDGIGVPSMPVSSTR